MNLIRSFSDLSTEMIDLMYANITQILDDGIHIIHQEIDGDLRYALDKVQSLITNEVESWYFKYRLAIPTEEFRLILSQEGFVACDMPIAFLDAYKRSSRYQIRGY